MVNAASVSLDELEGRIGQAETSQQGSAASSTSEAIKAYMPQFLFVRSSPHLNSS